MNRSDKIKKLKAERGNDFLVAVESLKKVFASGVDVNVDDLVAELSQVSSVALVVADLQKSIDKFAETISNKPESIEIKGLSDVVSYLKQLKIPASEVTVEFDGKETIQEMTAAIDSLVKVVNSNIFVENNKPEDFIPTRRVRKVGNKLMFDDSTYSSGGGGGINAEGLATTAKQDDIIAAIAGISGTTSLPNDVILRYKSTDTNIIYVGEAANGSATSGALWKITRLDTTTLLDVTYADGNLNADNIWDNRESLSYS